MLSRKKPALIVCILILLHIAALAAADVTTSSLTILHTNDIHGQLMPLSSPDGATTGGFARQATLIRQIEEENPGHVLTLFAGDLLSRGDGLVQQDGGTAAIRLMARMGYDAMTPGNGDFYFGVENLTKLSKQAGFPMVLANIIDKASEKPLMKPYVIQKVGDIRVGIIGLGTIHENHPSCIGLKTISAMETAKTLVPEVREKADIVIVLSHLGIILDPLVAAAAPGIDVIVGGHSHTFLRAPIITPWPNKTGYTYIVQAGELGRYVGRLDLHLEKSEEGFRVTKAEGAPISINDSIAPDPAIQKELDKISRPLEKAVCVSEREISNKTTDTLSMAALATEILREHTRSDVVLLNRDAIQSGIKPGTVTMADIYKIHPFRNSILMAEMTGEQLRGILKQSRIIAAGCRFSSNSLWIEDREMGEIFQKSIYMPVTSSQLYKVAINDYLYLNLNRPR